MKSMTLEDQIRELKAGEEDFAVNWHDPEVELPADSGDVFTLSTYGFPMRLHYSSKHKAFNVYNFMGKSEVNERAIAVAAWAHIPKWWKYINDYINSRENKR